jgi:tellurite methyltransferase
LEERQKSAKGWSGYYDATEGRPPRPTLLRALDAFELEDRAVPPLALDLGCGTGRDTAEILRRGWRVLAIDAEAEALARLRAKLDADAAGRAELRCVPLEQVPLPPADLVNASFVLPFLPAPAFAALWSRIADALTPGGRFAGQLFGPRDSWVVSGRCWGCDRQELDRLLTGWTVERLQEEEVDGTTPRGEGKHWQIWHVNARRPAS